MFVTTLAVCGGFEAGMVFAVRVGLCNKEQQTPVLNIPLQPSFRAGNEGGVEFFGILSSVMISFALM